MLRKTSVFFTWHLALQVNSQSSTCGWKLSRNWMSLVWWFLFRAFVCLSLLWGSCVLFCFLKTGSHLVQSGITGLCHHHTWPVSLWLLNIMNFLHIDFFFLPEDCFIRIVPFASTFLDILLALKDVMFFEGELDFFSYIFEIMFVLMPQLSSMSRSSLFSRFHHLIFTPNCDVIY